MRLSVLIMVAVALLSGCANTGLRNITSRGEGPDEFAVVPNLPLEQPESYSELPRPAPGGRNRTEANPLNDGIAALSGRRSSPNAPIPARDAGLVTHATRFGVEPNIRQSLAIEDEKFRRRQTRLTQFQLFREDLYNRAYRRQALNPVATARQYQRAGIPVPSARIDSGRRR